MSEVPTTAIVAFPFRKDELSVLRSELAGAADLQCCQSAVEVLGLAAESPPLVFLVGMRDRRGASTVPVIDVLRREFPRVPVIAYCELTYGDLREAFAAGHAGVQHVVVRGYDSTLGVLQRILREAQGCDVLDVVLTEIAPLATPTLRELLVHGITHAHRHPSVAQVAAALRVSSVTLTSALRRDGLPAPGQVLSWCRLLVAARGLENPGCSVSRVAAELGFASASELRMMLMRHTGLRPGEVRACGGLPFLAARFHGRLSEYPDVPRAAVRQTGGPSPRQGWRRRTGDD
jgi:AraC-like DNA-binding protein